MHGHHTPYVALAILLVLFILAKVFLQTPKRSRKTPANLHYAARPLLTPPELEFFHALRSAVDNEHYICCKVKLADLISLEPPDRATWNTFCQKHADFVLCDPTTMHPVHVIELDDSSHDTDRAKQSDAIKTRVLRLAGLKLTRFVVSRSYPVDYIRRRIQTTIDPANIKPQPTEA